MRIKTEIWISALRRRVEAAGGFATIVAKGEVDAGAVLLLLRDAGRTTALSRVNMGDGQVSWQPIFEDREDRDPAVHDALEKRRKFDPDLWVVELDIENPKRFIDKD